MPLASKKTKAKSAQWLSTDQAQFHRILRLRLINSNDKTIQEAKHLEMSLRSRIEKTLVDQKFHDALMWATGGP